MRCVLFVTVVRCFGPCACGAPALHPLRVFLRIYWCIRDCVSWSVIAVCAAVFRVCTRVPVEGLERRVACPPVGPSITLCTVALELAILSIASERT